MLPGRAGYAPLYTEGGAAVKLKAQIMDEAALRRALMRISHEITEKNNIHCVMTASLPAEDVPASLASFIRDAH